MRQKVYEPKVGPKHYRPELMDRRMQHFEENFTHPSFKKTATNLPKALDSKLLETAGDGRNESAMKSAKFKPMEGEIFCVASFSDWMPMRMKSLRKLNMEKFPMDTIEADIPKKIKTLDTQVVLCAQMVPPGYHYFYFVKDKGTIFLSPNYEVVRFKKTNIFLNRILVIKRLEDMTETVHVAKAIDDEEPQFMKNRSVFKNYREDTQAYLRKCFEEDFQFSKVPKLTKKGQDQE